MAIRDVKFESQDRRIKQILAALNEVGIRGRYMESGRSGEMADYNSGASNKVV